ncbi:MAG: hypothetical protein ACREV9_12465 [Burkholderiales bacterium]
MIMVFGAAPNYRRCASTPRQIKILLFMSKIGVGQRQQDDIRCFVRNFEQRFDCAEKHLLGMAVAAAVEVKLNPRLGD